MREYEQDSCRSAIKCSGSCFLFPKCDIVINNVHYSHYRILDINGDGVNDMLLKGEDNSLIGNTDYYWIALTYRYGHIEGIVSDFYLCEDSVLEKVKTRHAGGFGVEKNGHQFMRCIGLLEVPT